MDKEQLKQYRYFLKESIRGKINFKFTDQNQGIAAPPLYHLCHPAVFNELLGLDGDEAFAVYLAPVGKVKVK